MVIVAMRFLAGIVVGLVAVCLLIIAPSYAVAAIILFLLSLILIGSQGRRISVNSGRSQEALIESARAQPGFIFERGGPGFSSVRPNNLSWQDLLSFGIAFALNFIPPQVWSAIRAHFPALFARVSAGDERYFCSALFLAIAWCLFIASGFANFGRRTAA